MKIKFLTFIGILALLSASMVSCIKDNAKDLGTRGTPRVRLGEAPEASQFFSVFTGAKTVDLVTVRRDEVKESDVTQTLTITVVNDTAALTQYNTDNGTEYEPLPDSIYTLVTGKGVTQSGNNFTVAFDPRVTAIPISIVVNGSKWDLAHSYAMYFKITDGGGKEIYPDNDKVMSVIAIKNDWDGIYSVESGNVTRYTSPGVPAGDALSGSVVGQPDVTLATVGSSTVEITNLRWANGGGIGGINNLRATVDPATNQVTMFALGNGTLANWAGYDNYYDPDTKTFYLGFIWNPTANVRTYEVVLKYKGPR